MMLTCKKYFIILMLVINGLGFAANTTAMAVVHDPIITPDPVKMLNDSAKVVIQQIKDVRKEQGIKSSAVTPFFPVAKIINEILLPDVDLAVISQETIGPAFSKATLADQQHFIDAYKTLLINTYGVVLSHYQDQKAVFFKVRGGYQNQTRINVNSQFIFPDRDPINVVYTLILNKDNQWRVIDVSVEGVSLLESFKAQFSAELQKGGMTQLLATLDAHNKEVIANMSRSNATTTVQKA